MMPWIDENFHVTFGPGAAEISPDELKRATDTLRAKATKDYEEYNQAARLLDGLPYMAVPIDQLASIYERFCRLIPLGQTEVREIAEQPKAVRELKRAVFEQADFGAVFAGQWLPPAMRKEIHERVKAETDAQRLTPTNAEDK